MKKRFFSLLLALIMFSFVLLNNGYANLNLEQKEFTDIDKHWAKNVINKWAISGVVVGYPDGTFRPDKEVTRAEFVKVIGKVFMFTEKSEEKFIDVPEKEWFAESVYKALVANVLSGYEDKTFRPQNKIMRQEAAVILAKAFELQANNLAGLDRFSDNNKIASWSKEAVSALAENDYIKGRNNNEFAPDMGLTRAEVMQIMDNIVGYLITQEGTYTNNPNNNMVVNKKDVTLKGITIPGNLYLTQGIEDGNVYLDNVTVKGKTIVLGGGENSIIIENSNLEDILIVKKADGKVRILAKGTTTIPETEVKSGVKLEEIDSDGNCFGQVQIIQLKSNEKIDIQANIQTLEISAPKANIFVSSGRINELKVADTAKESTIELAESVVVDSLVLDSQVSVTGTGKIEHAEINANDIVIESTPVKVTLNETVNSAIVGGENVGNGEKPTPSPSITPSSSSTQLPGSTPSPGGTTISTTGITLNVNSLQVDVGKTITGSVMANLSNGTTTSVSATYESSDQSIAVVNTNGVITGVSEGNVTITANYGSYTSSKSISVSNPWTISWQDDFDTLNTDDWTVIDTATVYNNELEYYSNREGEDANAYIEDGKLVLEAREESYEGKDYTSAKLVTQGKKYWTNGRFEIKAKLPGTQGIWPAIWMLPEDDNLYGGWPLGGEIDIMEFLGHELDTVYGTVHYGNPHGSGQGSYQLPGEVDFTNSYHVFALEWEPGEMRWYIDGHLYHTENIWFSQNENEADPYTYPAPFDRDFYLILNVAVGGDWPGNPDESTVFPAKMLVDYVKVYELTGRPLREAGELPEVAKEPQRETLADGNYVYNGDFAQDTAEWDFKLNDGVGTISIDSGAAKIDITDAGNVAHSVQLVQDPLFIEKGESYRVSFRGKASDQKSIITKITQVGGGWSAYSGEQTIELTDSWNDFSFDFKMKSSTDDAARIDFNVGNQGTGSIWIDDVRIEKLPPDPDAARDVLPSGNLIYNGTFDQGTNSMKYWTFNVSEDADAVGNVDSDPYKREFEATINSVGQNAKSVRLSQDSLNVENSKTYRVSFEAKADSARTIELSVGSSTDTLINYSDVIPITLSTQMKNYSFVFEMQDVTDKNSQLNFDLGGAIGTVIIDNVSLKNKIATNTIFVEAEDTNITGAAANGDFVTFSGDSNYLTQSINITETGNYAISYRVATNADTGWLSIGSADNKQTLPNSGGATEWMTVTNTIYLEEGNQDLVIYGDGVNLNWFELAKDIVTNGNMNTSLAGWTSWATAPAVAVATIENKSLKMAITNTGTNPWDVGINQPGLLFEKGKIYRLSFDAKSTLERNIGISLDKADYSKYLTKEVALTSTMKNYIYDFSMDYDTDSNTTLVFTLGNISNFISANDVYIDNVRLMEITDIVGDQVIEAPVITEPEEPEEPEEPVSDNLIVNGTFDTDKTSWSEWFEAGEGSATVESGELKMDVTAVPGDIDYRPQIKQENISFEAGTYTVSFKARASVERAMKVDVLNASYNWYGGDVFDITTSDQTFTFTVTMAEAINDGLLTMNLGTIAERTSVPSIVYIDDVSITKNE